METRACEYPKANINLIMSKVRGALENFGYKDFIGKFLGLASIEKDAVVNICNDTTSLALRELLGRNITEHEIVTFLRYYRARKSMQQPELYDRSTMKSLVQMTLKNQLWDDMQAVKEFMYDAEPQNHNSFITPCKLAMIVKGCRIPIKENLLRDMFAM